jgi:hypothetical protein
MQIGSKRDAHENHAANEAAAADAANHPAASARTWHETTARTDWASAAQGAAARRRAHALNIERRGDEHTSWTGDPANRGRPHK